MGGRKWNGLEWLIVGAVIMATSLLIVEGADRPFIEQPLPLWGVEILALILMGVGVYRLLSGGGLGEAARAARARDNDLVVCLRIWLIAAAADGALHEREIAVIIRNAKRYFDLTIDRDFVCEIYEQMKARTSPSDIDDELFASEEPLTADGVRRVLVGAIHVALFDGELDPHERRVIDRLATQFELDSQMIDEMIAEARAEIAADPAAGETALGKSA